MGSNHQVFATHQHPCSINISTTPPPPSSTTVSTSTPCPSVMTIPTTYRGTYQGTEKVFTVYHMPTGPNQLYKAIITTLTITSFREMTIRNLRYNVARFYTTATEQQLSSLPTTETPSRANLVTNTHEPGTTSDLCALATRLNRIFLLAELHNPNITPVYPIAKNGSAKFDAPLASNIIIILHNNQYSEVITYNKSLRGCSQIKIIILNVIVTFGGEGGKPCDVSNVNISKNISNCFFIVLQL